MTCWSRQPSRGPTRRSGATPTASSWHCWNRSRCLSSTPASAFAGSVGAPGLAVRPGGPGGRLGLGRCARHDQRTGRGRPGQRNPDQAAGAARPGQRRRVPAYHEHRLTRVSPRPIAADLDGLVASNGVSPTRPSRSRPGGSPDRYDVPVRRSSRAAPLCCFIAPIIDIMSSRRPSGPILTIWSPRTACLRPHRQDQHADEAAPERKIGRTTDIPDARRGRRPAPWNWRGRLQRAVAKDFLSYAAGAAAPAGPGHERRPLARASRNHRRRPLARASRSLPGCDRRGRRTHRRAGRRRAHGVASAGRAVRRGRAGAGPGRVGRAR